MLKRKVVGIDISDKSIKIIESRIKKNTVTVLNYSYVRLKKGVIENGEIKDEETLKITVQEMFDKAQPHSINANEVCLGIPDYQIFNHYEPDIKFDKKFEKDKVKSLAYKNIPIEKANMLISSKVKPLQNNGHYEVLVFGTYKDIITRWENFFNSMEMELISVMSSSGGAALAIDPEKKLKSSCVLDIGEKFCNININKENDTVYSYSMDNAGALITNNISQSKNNADNKPLPWAEAERIKTDFDSSNPNSNEQAIGLLINNTVRSISSAAQSLIEICANKKNVCTYNIFLCGGSSKIKNIQKLVQEHFNNVDVSQNCKIQNNEEAGKEEEKGEKITPKVPSQKIQVSLANSGFLQAAGLDPLFLQAVGLCYSITQNNELFFTKERIRLLVKENEAQQRKKEEEDTKEKEASEKNESWIRNNPKLVILVAVFVAGLLLLPVAFWIRKNNAEKRAAELNQYQEYSVEAKHTLTARALLEGNTAQDEQATIKSRIEIITIKDNQALEQAISIAQNEAKNLLRKHEKVWPLPLNLPENTGSVIYPLDLEFLVYNENDISAIAMQGGRDRYGTNEFILSELKLSDIRVEDDDIEIMIDVSYMVNPGIENMLKDLDRDQAAAASGIGSSSDDQIPTGDQETISEQSDEENSEESEEKNETLSLEQLQALLNKANQEKYENYITVLESGLGWLNVRSGPGTGYEIVDQIKTGEVYELIEEDENWSEIKLSQGISGWVSNDYITITKTNE